MKSIALIALAVALGLAWTGVALPADEVKDKAREAKQDAKEAARDAKEATKDAARDAKDAAKDAKDTVKDTTHSAIEKTKEKLSYAKDRVAAGQVRAAQEALKEKGFDPGPVDGVMGPKTRAAVREFQRKEGIAETGRLDLTTSSRLGSDRTAQTSGAASPATTEPRPAQTQKP
jgi:peptidoglycan hydrolase-like protein with peptidoglycan-binding domain